MKSAPCERGANSIGVKNISRKTGFRARGSYALNHTGGGSAQTSACLNTVTTVYPVTIDWCAIGTFQEPHVIHFLGCHRVCHKVFLLYS